MPIYIGILSASVVENIAIISPNPKRSFGFKLKCTNCNEISENYIYSSQEEIMESSGGIANCFYKCKGCNNIVSVSLLDDGVVGKILNNNNNNNKNINNKYRSIISGIPVIAADFRSCEPVEVEFDEQWYLIAGEICEDDNNDDENNNNNNNLNNNNINYTGGRIDNVDISEDFSDYDEKTGKPVVLENVRFVFVREGGLMQALK